MASGDIDDNGSDDLIIGTPFEDFDVNVNGNPVTYTNTGMIQVLRSTKADGLTIGLGSIDDDGYDYGDNQNFGWSLATLPVPLSERIYLPLVLH